MEEKDDRENLGNDLGQQQRQFLLELSSAFQDRVISPGIVIARMMQSNDAISEYDIFVSFTESAPPETNSAGVIKKSAGRIMLAMYITYLRKLSKPHLSQPFLPWSVEGRPHQEDAH